MRIDLPPYVELAINTLQCGGYEAYAVGGCVRDSLLGAWPKDWDIATNAGPPDIIRVFTGYRQLTHGEKYGTVTVLFEDTPVEITAYRTDGAYSDNRRPDSVSFTNSLRDDLSRRDFTINALAYNYRSGLIDFFGGRNDLTSAVVRCVGRPEERFGEDALRILRALRLAARLSFDIEDATSAAIHKLRRSLKNIAGERICAELTGILTGGAGTVDILTGYYDVIRVLVPELNDMGGGYRRHIMAMAHTRPDLALRLALLLCAADTGGSGKDMADIMPARRIMRRLRFSNEIIDVASDLLMYRKADIPSTGTEVKHMLNRIGEGRLRLLFQMRRALDMRSLSVKPIDDAEELLDGIVLRRECYSLNGLNVNGNDLVSIGYVPGKSLGAALSALLDLVVAGECANERQALLARAKCLANE